MSTTGVWGGGWTWPSPGDTSEPAHPALPDDQAPVHEPIIALGLSHPSQVFCPWSLKETLRRRFIFRQKVSWPPWETSNLPSNQENTRTCWVFPQGHPVWASPGTKWVVFFDLSGTVAGVRCTHFLRGELTGLC